MALINFDQLGKQLVDWGGDYDVFGDRSFDGGVRDANPRNIPTSMSNFRIPEPQQGAVKSGYTDTGRKVLGSVAPAGGGGGAAPSVNVTDQNYQGGGGGNAAFDAAAAAKAEQEAKDAAERQALIDEISGYRGRTEDLFKDIFGRIENEAKSRRGRIDKTYGEQDAQYTQSFQEAVPQIDNAFAALGIGNSTYAGDRIDKATDEYESSLSKSNDNRQADLAGVGSWLNQQKGEFQGNQRNINDAINRSKGVEDVSELREARNNITSTLNNTEGKRGAFNADGEAIQALDKATGRSSNFDSAMESLNGILGSSMDVGTKSAAKTALVENGDLDDEEKKKLSEVQVNNAYGRPATT